VFEVLAFVLPLGLDSFAIAAAVGAAGPLPPRTRWRITAIFVMFEGGMPLVGLAVGAPVAHAVGSVADYVAAAALVATGAWSLLRDDEDDADRLARTRGIALFGLGASISLDELVVGFDIGLTRQPLSPVVVGITVQALVAAQLGLLLGARLAERHREWAERLAAVVLIGLGGYVAVHRMISWS
jgi:manganese efflux pump family protein